MDIFMTMDVGYDDCPGIKQYVDKHSTSSRQLGHGSDEDAWVYYCERNNGPNVHFPYNVGSFAFTKTLRRWLNIMGLDTAAIRDHFNLDPRKKTVLVVDTNDDIF